jgi:hypothetical protein
MRASHRQRNKHSQSTNPKETKGADKLSQPPPFVPPNYTNQPNGHPDQSHHHKRDRLDYAAFGVSIFTLLFVGFYTLLTGCQTHNSNTQTEADTRAWIAPYFARLLAMDNGGIKVQVDFKNVGRSPAARDFILIDNDGVLRGPKGVIATDYPNEVDAAISSDASCDLSTTKVRQLGGPEFYTHMADSDPYTFTFSDKSNTPDIPDILNGTAIFFFHGCVGYTTNGVARQSKFCFFLLPNPGQPIDKWKFGFCLHGNSAT